ncbi:MAG: hypothetical protein CMJ75_07050 [Planctomycetaceae bacterium]|nr:hypothetical protein [Planctomycetaceae bacterium]
MVPGLPPSIRQTLSHRDAGRFLVPARLALRAHGEGCPGSLASTGWQQNHRTPGGGFCCTHAACQLVSRVRHALVSRLVARFAANIGLSANPAGRRPKITLISLRKSVFLDGYPTTLIGFPLDCG